MKKISMHILAALVILTFVSCKKDQPSTPEPVLSNPNTGTLNDFFKANTSGAQTFTVAAANTETVMGAKGTVIIIQPGTFITRLGATVSGNVVVSLTEIYSKKDIILNRVQTTTSTDVLISKGAMKITARQNDIDLIIKPGKKLAIKTPAGTSPSYSMQVFYGATNFTGSFYWSLAPGTGTSIAATPVQDTNNVINPYYYAFSSDSLNWINCDQFYSSPNPKTTCTITVHGNYNASNTSVFLAFADINSAAQLNGTDQKYTNSYSIPIGTKATVVAIARIGGNYYASYTPIIITANFILDINLSATNETEIHTKLNAL
jgi:hypothetical protein